MCILTMRCKAIVEHAKLTSTAIATSLFTQSKLAVEKFRPSVFGSQQFRLNSGGNLRKEDHKRNLDLNQSSFELQIEAKASQ